MKSGKMSCVLNVRGEPLCSIVIFPLWCVLIFEWRMQIHQYIKAIRCNTFWKKHFWSSVFEVNYCFIHVYWMEFNQTMWLFPCNRDHTMVQHQYTNPLHRMMLVCIPPIIKLIPGDMQWSKSLTCGVFFKLCACNLLRIEILGCFKVYHKPVFGLLLSRNSRTFKLFLV